MERQKKRRRDADCPIVTYRVGLRTFERLLKEDSLEETKEAIRQKLKVEDGVQVQLAQLRGGMTIDLEDEDDFDAFHTAAHKTSGATVKVTVIRANGVPASHVSIRPTDSISNAVATSSRSVRFSSPEDELPPTGGKRKASAIEPASDGESASIPRRHRPVKKRRDEAPEDAPEPHQPEEPAQEDEEPEPAPVVVKKKRGRPPKVKPLEGAQTLAGTSASAGASASAAVPAPEASAPDAMDTAPDSVQPAPLPEKKKRGRPRKDSMSASAQPASAASKPASQVATTVASQSASTAGQPDVAPVPVKRKPGRPRKHPLPEEAPAAQHHSVQSSVPEVVIEQPSTSRGRSASRRPTDPDNDVGDANAAQEEASKKKRTRSRSRSRAADDAKASKLKAALAQDDTAQDDGALAASASAHVTTEPSIDAETPSTTKRGRKKKVVAPSGEDADNEDASPEVETVPKERKKKKKVAQEAVGR
ncbi:hypothetical protein K523DRAFT_344596 [Schizophyllum commune Tattone D]|nr:hypothetical protein K525DRAFT_360001 [Schizophyllum commune Loenen D]KAI5832571.1 hypothetical protein K523DRAFT_344596 [Schizophyllum commune Tattone D]